MNTAKNDVQLSISGTDTDMAGAVETLTTTTARRISSRDTFRRKGSIKGSIKFSAHNFVTQSYDSFSDHYEIQELLGEGGYGEVYVCRHRESGAERAVKIIDLKSEDQAETILAEFNVLKGLDHPNLLKVYQLYEDRESSRFYIVTDLYEGGELFEEIELGGRFVEEDAAIIINQLLSCLNYCHSQGVIHRDVKPENILLTDEAMNLNDCKLIDFGLSAVFDDYENDRFYDKVGSAYYIAPEVLKRSGHGPKADIWSCGVVCFILLTGFAPFDGDNDNEITDAIMTGEVRIENDPIWNDVSEDAISFIFYLLTYDEKNRPTAEEALGHPWLENMRLGASQHFVERESMAALNSLTNLERFRADSKLKQAACAYIASQVLTRKDKDEIGAVFRAMDENCDGRLSKTELKEGFKRFAGRELNGKEVDNIFQRVNFSGTGGGIEYSEFVVASIDNLWDDDKVTVAFKMFDKQGNGYLTPANIQDVLGVSESGLAKIMNQVKHTDGVMSYADFKEAMLSDVQQTEPRRRTLKNRGSLKRASQIIVHDDLDDCKAALDQPELGEPQSLGLEGIRHSWKSLQKPIKAAKSLEHSPHDFSLCYACRRRSLRRPPTLRTKSS